MKRQNRILQWKAFKRRYKKIEVLPISAQAGEGIEALKTRIGELVLGEVKAGG